MASRVEDRFGRGVTYHWSGSQLNSIVADDGRTITLTWTNGRITSASAHGRTWTYSYSGTLGEPAVDWLHQVTQPDASKFTYVAEGTLIPLYPNPDVPNDATCQEADAAVSTFHLTATHPAGARVNYSFNYQRHYRSGVPTGACVGDGNGAFSLAIPDYSDVYSLVSREQFGIQPVTDPVLVTPTTLRTFSYETASYGRTTAAIPCASCPQSKTTRVTEPDGSVGEYEFGVLHALNEGRLLKTVTRASAGGAILREEINTYVTEADAASAPYPDVYGINSGAIDPAATRVRPIKQTTIKQQGVDFIQSTTLFDSYARPRYLTRSSTLGYSRSEVRTYHDHLGKWVVGQLAALEVGAQRPQETTYDPTWALPTHQYAFGKLKRQTTYHTSGDQAGRPHEVYDGSSLKKTTLTNYYRGTPQLVTYHDATTESAVVNALGESPV